MPPFVSCNIVIHPCFIWDIVLSQKDVEIQFQVEVAMRSIGHFRRYQEYGLSFSILITRPFLQRVPFVSNHSSN